MTAQAVSPGAVKFRLRARAFESLLRRRRFRQADVAAACGVSKATVTLWKLGRIAVRGDYALTVAALLNASFDELFERKGGTA